MISIFFKNISNDLLSSSPDDAFIPGETEFQVKVENTEINLFVWAILLNRIEIAKIFWKIGKVWFFFKLQNLKKFYLNLHFLFESFK